MNRVKFEGEFALKFASYSRDNFIRFAWTCGGVSSTCPLKGPALKI